MNWERCRRGVVALMAAGLLLGLSACRDNEQDRPLAFDKGVYGGKPDQKLSGAEVDALRGRAMEQKI